MDTTSNTKITVETTVKLPVDKTWTIWTEPQHITQWTQASDDWHAPYAENDLKTGGKFKTAMAAKDGSVSFDFEGVYDAVKQHEVIAYTLLDGRKVKITFTANGNETQIAETFEAEAVNSQDMQKAGWQAILENFKKYAESLP